MQNNEVKAILISLGDEPNASRARGMRNAEEQIKLWVKVPRLVGWPHQVWHWTHLSNFSYSQD